MTADDRIQSIKDSALLPLTPGVFVHTVFWMERHRPLPDALIDKPIPPHEDASYLAALLRVDGKWQFRSRIVAHIQAKTASPGDHRFPMRLALATDIGDVALSIVLKTVIAIMRLGFTDRFEQVTVLAEGDEALPILRTCTWLPEMKIAVATDDGLREIGKPNNPSFS